MTKQTPFLLTVLSAIWGASFLLIKIGVADMGPLTLAMFRTLVGSLGLLLAIRLSGQRIPRRLSTWGRFAVMGAVGIALPFGAISWGTQYIPSGLSAILNAAMPLFTVVIASLWGDERLTARRIGGVLLGLAGILVLTAPHLREGLAARALGRDVLLGELAVVLAALAYAAAIVYARHHLAGIPPLTASLGQVSTGWLCLLPFSLLERPWQSAPSTQAIGAVVALGLLGTALAYILYSRLLQSAGATATSMVTYIVPLFGILWGWALLGEQFGWNAFLALGLILLGSALVSRVRLAPLPRQAGLAAREP